MAWSSLPGGTYVHHLKLLVPEIVHQEVEDASVSHFYRDLTVIRTRGAGLREYVVAGHEIRMKQIVQLLEPITSRRGRPRFHFGPRTCEPFLNKILCLNPN